MQLFLTIDIGNTNIVVALFNEDTLVSSWRLHTDVSRTGDEYGILISSFFTEQVVLLLLPKMSAAV